jgi:hypothetical protein
MNFLALKKFRNEKPHECSPVDQLLEFPSLEQQKA